MQRQLPHTFFAQDAETVARELLGAELCVRGSDGVIHRHSICETEAYVGPHDLACHAAKGRTPRTEVMFGPPGHWYVYLIYGMYHMLNVVTDANEYPAAVLIRAAGPYGGPGVLTRDLGIYKEELNTLPVQQRSGVWIREGQSVFDEQIQKTPRIGIGYAGEWADAPLRFVCER